MILTNNLFQEIYRHHFFPKPMLVLSDIKFASDALFPQISLDWKTEFRRRYPFLDVWPFIHHGKSFYSFLIGNLWTLVCCCAVLKSTIIPGCSVTPLASQKEVHLMEMLRGERSSGGWCLLGKVVTIKISRQSNIRQFELSLHLIWFRSDLKCQGDEESLENCPGISTLPISMYLLDFH